MPLQSQSALLKLDHAIIPINVSSIDFKLRCFWPLSKIDTTPFQLISKAVSIYDFRKFEKRFHSWYDYEIKDQSNRLSIYLLFHQCVFDGFKGEDYRFSFSLFINQATTEIFKRITYRVPEICNQFTLFGHYH